MQFSPGSVPNVRQLSLVAQDVANLWQSSRLRETGEAVNGHLQRDWEIQVDFIGRSARHGASLNQQGPVISGRNRTQYGEREVGGRAEGEEIVMSVDIRSPGGRRHQSLHRQVEG